MAIIGGNKIYLNSIIFVLISIFPFAKAHAKGGDLIANNCAFSVLLFLWTVGSSVKNHILLAVTETIFLGIELKRLGGATGLRLRKMCMTFCCRTLVGQLTEVK